VAKVAKRNGRRKAKDTRRTRSTRGATEAQPAEKMRKTSDREPNDSAISRTADAPRGASLRGASLTGASRRVVAATPAIVIKAASILEEELASGLRAAKHIERRFLNVDALRTQDPDAVMLKFRRDAHDAVDIILDILTAATQTVSAQAGRFINVTAGAGAAKPDDGLAPDVSVPALRVPGTIAAGSSGEVSVLLENTSEVRTSNFTLHCSDLLSATGAKIAAESVSFSPETLSVEPKTSGRVALYVNVPAGTPAGKYEGFVRATQLESLRALLSVVVG
jgi:hypothetical protein